MTTEMLAEKPMDSAHREAILGTYHRDGVAKVPQVLSGDECAALCRLTDQLADDDAANKNGHVTAVGNTMVLRYIQALDDLFTELVAREPIYGFGVEIVGPGPKLCGMNVIRSYSNQAISNWHVDDYVEIPLGPGQTRHDPMMRMPTNWFSIQIALTDIENYEQGPTEIVPGSHYSGRSVPVDDLVFDGRGPVSIFCKAGDAYLFNHQVWHRGAPNTSADTRYLMQIQYCRAAVFHRFSDHKNTQTPPNFTTDNANTRDVLAMPR